jgi:iron-sulfur cluster repair protein YtfE (RIC family)
MGLEARRLLAQHRKLDELYEAAVTTLIEEPRAKAERAFLRFREALDAHFSLEDEVYFPALHGLRKDLGERLEHLSSEHERLRTKAGQLAEVLHNRPREICLELLREISAAVSAHEEAEEDLIGLFRDDPGKNGGRGSAAGGSPD